MTSQKFVILGGGTAGWMTALLFQRAFPGCLITLIESQSIGTIGVGEGSTPALKSFLDAIGVAEADWMPRCKATYKSGITFDGWSTAQGFENYFHPFLTQFDRDHVKALQHNSLLRRSGCSVHAHPDLFCYSHYLAQRRLCPIPPYAFPFEVQYGYHFNAGLLGEYLKEIGVARGIRVEECRIVDVVLDGQGDVSHLLGADGRHFDADFFVDCSGFSALIVGAALKVDEVSYAEALFNDRAVTIPTGKEAEASTQTVATALRNGWAWRIPQQDRVGNGYVYSSRYCSDAEAEAELRSHLNISQQQGEARIVRFRTGRVTSVWNRNTLAVGLSQGFLEPLEATALALVQLTISRFVKHFQEGGSTNANAEKLNQEIAAAYDGVKDYIHTHFLISNRDDTQYWRDCRNNASAVSPGLRSVIECWFAGGDLAATLQATGLGRHYKLNSWLYILAGMGLFPPEDKLVAAKEDDLRKVPVEEIREFFERCSSNHMPQLEALEMLSKGVQPHAESIAAYPDALERLTGLEFGVSAP